MKKRIIGTACIVFGICIMAFPFCKERYEDYTRQKILTAWQQETALLLEGETDTETGDAGTSQSIDTTDALAPEEIVTVLKIPAIDLEQPVLAGTTKEHLDLSLATIEPTGAPGDEGNFVVAGHNSRTYGRHFNRLSEISEGDLITVETTKDSYDYYATDSYVVNEDEVWVLSDTLPGAEITLMTCYYPREGEVQRLIVKGVMR